MFNYKTSQISYKVLEKHQIIERIDNKSSDNIIILGTFCPFHGDRLPPSPKRSILLIFITGGGAVMTAWWEENAKEKQEKFQDRILSWNNSVMDFEEGRISARGTVEITADDWGVKIIFTSESFDNPVRLSGVWGILSVGETSISSAYTNWYLSLTNEISSE